MTKIDFQKTKAFLFDMDGVLINSEKAWKIYEHEFLKKLGGNKIYEMIKDDLIGTSIKETFRIMSQNGSKITWEEYIQKYDKIASKVYKISELTNGIEQLLEFLKSENKKIALVSASRQNWIESVLPKFRKNYFDEVVSVVDTDGLKDKPEPDGYLEAMKRLGVKAEEVVIMEDSNTGLMAAKKAKPSQIFAMTEHLVKGYQQIEVGIKTKNIQELKSHFGIK